jgi:hypothetical protein
MSEQADYIMNLRQTAIGLTMQATEARRRGIHGLADMFTQAADSAAAWAEALGDELNESRRAG